MGVSDTPRLRTAIVLFTRDLRVSDNPALALACRSAQQVVPLFVVHDGLGFAVPNRASFLRDCLPEGGESAARRRMDDWLSTGLAGYADHHDDLPGDATSRLSADLHFGCLSPLELAVRARRIGGPGGEAYVRQLCWRDFHAPCCANSTCRKPRAAEAKQRPVHSHHNHCAERT